MTIDNFKYLRALYEGGLFNDFKHFCKKNKISQLFQLYCILSDGKEHYFAELNKYMFRYGALIFKLRKLDINVDHRQDGYKHWYKCTTAPCFVSLEPLGIKDKVEMAYYA